MRAIDEQVGIPMYKKTIAAEGTQADQMKFVAPPHGKDSAFFVRPKRFYEDTETGFKYYCESVSEGTARMYLVESYQHGQLIQAEFNQKIIHATKRTYLEIEDKGESARLRKMVRKLCRPHRSTEAQADDVQSTPVRPQRRTLLPCAVLGALICTVCGWITSWLTKQELMPLVAWAAVGCVAGLLGSRIPSRQ